MTRELAPPFATHEPEKTPSFADFLLARPEISDTDPATTVLEFDLDETMFRRDRHAEKEGPPGSLTGSWRPDMPEALQKLRAMGFNAINILSSARVSYIRAALEIYAQQFGHETATLFDKLRTIHDHDVAGYGTKPDIFPEVARLNAEEGKRTIFIDDANIYLGPSLTYDFIRVPAEMSYHGEGATLYSADLAQ